MCELRPPPRRRAKLHDALGVRGTADQHHLRAYYEFDVLRLFQGIAPCTHRAEMQVAHAALFRERDGAKRATARRVDHGASSRSFVIGAVVVRVILCSQRADPACLLRKESRFGGGALDQFVRLRRSPRDAILSNRDSIRGLDAGQHEVV